MNFKKAINTARTVLFNEFGYNADEIAPDDMYIVWFCKTCVLNAS